MTPNPPRKWLHCAPRLSSHPRRFPPAAVTAPRKDHDWLFGPRLGWDRNGVSSSWFFRAAARLREVGEGSLAASRRCGAQDGHPAPGRPPTQHPAPSASPGDPSLPPAAPRGGLAPAGPCSHAGVAGRWRALQSAALMTSRKDPPASGHAAAAAARRCWTRGGTGGDCLPGVRSKKRRAGSALLTSQALLGLWKLLAGPPTEHEASPLPARSSEAHKGSLGEVPGPSPS